jgi:exosortase C (VPDSG-CTERM-specific)
MVGYLVWTVLAALLFGKPLYQLVAYAAGSDLHSHIPLIPLISAYLLHTGRRRLPPPGSRAWGAGSAFGVVTFALFALRTVWQEKLSANDDLALMALSFVAFLAAGGFVLLGTRWMAAAAFPIGFLIFLAPLPDAGVQWLEGASAAASAEAAAWYFAVAGTPLVRHGTVFELPGIILAVAQECSGIRSSWVLFITSILASHLFLRSPWRRIVLVAFVIPLGILRNGFRVFVIGMLCVHIGPHMIDSVVHHSGGPLFFALSLVPLFLLLWWLRRGEWRTHPGAPFDSQSDGSLAQGEEAPRLHESPRSPQG